MLIFERDGQSMLLPPALVPGHKHRGQSLDPSSQDRGYLHDITSAPLDGLQGKLWRDMVNESLSESKPVRGTVGYPEATRQSQHAPRRHSHSPALPSDLRMRRAEASLQGIAVPVRECVPADQHPRENCGEL